MSFQGMWRPLRAGLAAAAALAAVGVGGWQFGVIDATRPPSMVVLRTPPPPTVEVDTARLVGQPVHVVLAQLRRLGLEPRLVWVTSGAHAPGTALSVQPGGRLLPGTIAVVTAAAQFVQQGDQNGGAGAEPGGGGNGGGDGGGDGNGGGGGGPLTNPPRVNFPLCWFGPGPRSGANRTTAFRPGILPPAGKRG